MNILIVHAHHEPKSFSSALLNQAALSLRALGHDVVISDLYSMGFNPVSDRRNFTTVKDSEYLKQQAEEAHAAEADGFAPEIEAEIQKLEAADAVIFNFPMWWFGMPAILKGWVDRVMASGRVYGGGKLYENGIGKNQKRGLVMMTTGGGPDFYGGWGVNPAMDLILGPIQHGVFWFNGIRPLDPFVAWSPARVSDEERAEYLASLDKRLKGLFDEATIELPPLADFPDFGTDRKERFAVVVELTREPDDHFQQLVPDEQATIAKWKQQGRLLDFQMAEPTDKNWRAFMTFRADDGSVVEKWLAELPLVDYLKFEITKIAKP